MSDRNSYNPKVVGVNSTISVDADEIEGFLATTAGTVSCVDSRGTTIFTGVPVTAGSFSRLPFYVGPGATFTTAGGASGTLAVG